MSEELHAEIIYETTGNEDYPYPHLVHSDICPPGCLLENIDDPEWRAYLHVCLDEWLNKSQGTGVFYIGDIKYSYADPNLGDGDK